MLECSSSFSMGERVVESLSGGEDVEGSGKVHPTILTLVWCTRFRNRGAPLDPGAPQEVHHKMVHLLILRGTTTGSGGSTKDQEVHHLVDDTRISQFRVFPVVYTLIEVGGVQWIESATREGGLSPNPDQDWSVICEG
jgi:hypothetical protein